MKKLDKIIKELTPKEFESVSINNDIGNIIYLEKQKCDLIKPKHIREEIETAFKTINNRNRWKYICNARTNTCSAFIRLLILFKRLLKNEGFKSSNLDEVMEIANRFLPKTPNTYFTLGLVFGACKIKKADLSDIGVKFHKFDMNDVWNYCDDPSKYYKIDDSKIKDMKKALKYIKECK